MADEALSTSDREREEMRYSAWVVMGTVLLVGCGSASTQSPAPITPSTTIQTGSTAAGPPAASAPLPSSAASTAGSPAKVSYLAAANAICKGMNDQVAALSDPGTDPVKAIDVVTQAKAITTDALRRLRAVSLPAGQEAVIRAIYAKVDTTIADAGQLIVALRSGNQQTIAAASSQLDADTKAANDASNAYGLTVCGS